jgi:hypothetical protein
VQNKSLRELLKFGPRFRTKVSRPPLQTLQEALDLFVNEHAQKHDLHVNEFDEWKKFIIKKASSHLKSKKESGYQADKRVLNISSRFKNDLS